MLKAQLLPVVVALSISVAGVRGHACESGHSAMTLGEVTYLVTDRRIVQLKDDEVHDGGPTPKVNVEGQTAAVNVPEFNQYILLTCSGDYVMSDEGEAVADVGFMFEEGGSKIDAATRRGDTIFFFLGDKYMTYDVRTEAISDLLASSDLGLPANVDAAWYNPSSNATFVLKADQIYVADVPDAQHQFYGPFDFDLFFNVPDLKLCSSS